MCSEKKILLKMIILKFIRMLRASSQCIKTQPLPLLSSSLCSSRLASLLTTVRSTPSASPSTTPTNSLPASRVSTPSSAPSPSTYRSLVYILTKIQIFLFSSKKFCKILGTRAHNLRKNILFFIKILHFTI